MNPYIFRVVKRVRSLSEITSTHESLECSTFAGMQIDFHCRVPPGVQDLPSNNIQYRHPEKHDKIHIPTAFPRHSSVFSSDQFPGHGSVR